MITLAVTLAKTVAAVAMSASVTVVPGQTLSGIAAQHHTTWPAVWAANPQIANPNLIYPGEVITIPAPGSHYTPRPVEESSYQPVYYTAPPQPAYEAPAPAYAAPAPASYSGDGGFQSCVIARESGGNASAVNAESGAGGLYQFLPSTWHSLGYSGLPQDASVAEQNAAFAEQYALSGTSAWGAYDGC